MGATCLACRCLSEGFCPGVSCLRYVSGDLPVFTSSECGRDIGCDFSILPVRLIRAPSLNSPSVIWNSDCSKSAAISLASFCKAA